MKKLDDEQLSRALSALEGGTLGPANQVHWGGGTACLVQTCDVVAECHFGAYDKNQKQLARWFDRWRSDRRIYAAAIDLPAAKFLRELEKAGIA